MNAAVRMSHLAYALPAASATVAELSARGLVTSDAGLLEQFGFERVHTAELETPYELALAAARSVIEQAGIDTRAIGLVVWGGAQGPTAFTVAPTPAESSAAHRSTARFRYPAPRLQHELGLENAMVLGVDQLACTTLFGAVRIARALCLVEGIDAALCIGADFHPADAGREAIWNCTSDAAAAVLVERGAGRNRIVATTHVTKGYYWDPDARRNEMVASYFPTASHVIEETIARAGWSKADVDWIIPHNVSRRSWDVLRAIAGLPNARIWDRNIARIGHTLAGDNFINLADALQDGDIARDEKLLLFSYGYGAHWTGIAVEA
jgi:3-oxoacyl-[acyl-carrier-protein] synthase III